MSDTIFASILICSLALAVTAFALRYSRCSLGLPFAYLSVLHLNHVPGAYAHLVRPDLFHTTEYVANGIWQTAVASICFAMGLLIAMAQKQSNIRMSSEAAHPAFKKATAGLRFWRWCLIGGWVLAYGLTPLRAIPSLGAMIEKGASIWMLGVMLGLRDAVTRSRFGSVIAWLTALAVYPTLMLVLGGFLSYGSAAAIIVVSVLVVSARSFLRVILSTVAAILLGLSIFVNYYIARDQIRSVTWSDASFSTRVDAIIEALSDVAPISLSHDKHAVALDERLNQNYFVGVAADRLERGWVEFRRGQSFYEAAIAPIPRAVWTEKPVFGGSGSVVKDMTGLELSETTSWGVGQVMELYINFGWSSLIIGFAGLGWLLGRLDIQGAIAERRGDIRALLVSFLPGVALIQPIGSLVELAGGAFAAYFVAICWATAWAYWGRRVSRA